MVGKNGERSNSSKNLISNEGIETFAVSVDCIPSESTQEPEPKAQHQILSAEDIRHFMLPHLPPSNSINSTYSADVGEFDVNTDRFIRDKTYSYMWQLTDMHKNSKIAEPTCCCLKITAVSIGSAVGTGVLLLILAAYVIIKSICSLRRGSEINLHLTGTSVAIAVMLLVIIALFITGIFVRRKRWLLPLILSMVCLCVALSGTLIAILITLADDFNEALTQHPNDRILIVTHVFLLRLSMLLLLALGVLVTGCYIQCYRYISLLDSETKRFDFRG